MVLERKSTKHVQSESIWALYAWMWAHIPKYTCVSSFIRTHMNLAILKFLWAFWHSRMKDMAWSTYGHLLKTNPNSRSCIPQVEFVAAQATELGDKTMGVCFISILIFPVYIIKSSIFFLASILQNQFKLLIDFSDTFLAFILFYSFL